MSAARRVAHQSVDPNLEMVVRAKAGDRKAMSDLVAANLGYVWSIARKMALGCRMLTAEDLVSEGAIGLMHAVGKFDPARGIRFLTYASQWIWQRMSMAMQGETPMSGSGLVRAMSRSRKFRRERAELEADGMPDERIVATLATRYDTSENAIRGAMAMADTREVSLETIAFGQNGLTLGETLAAEQDSADDEADRARAQGRVAGVIRRFRAGLDERERRIFDDRVMGGADGMTLAEVAAPLGICRERVRQLEAQMLARLREMVLGAVPDLCPPGAMAEHRAQQRQRAAEKAREKARYAANRKKAKAGGPDRRRAGGG